MSCFKQMSKWVKRLYHLCQIYLIKWLFVLIISVTLILMIFYTTSLHKLRQQKWALGLYEKKNRSTKLIATWNKYWGDPYFGFGQGSKPFRDNNCTYQDCFIIHDRDNDVIDQYDAILFHGSELWENDIPQKRSPFQRYVYFNMESPLSNPAPSFVNSFFNLTMTYRIDSDILLFYFAFNDLNNTRISPSHKPQWIKRNSSMNEESLKKLENVLSSNRKPVAWFVSDCDANNDRMERALKLKEYIDVDIYGKCGDLSCPYEDNKCFEMLKNNYYFYLSYENSNCADYVTEKLFNAFRSDVVPIYYGGGDLENFAPPHSYIDARTMTTKELAEKLQYLIKNPKEYYEYFWWKDNYKAVLTYEVWYMPFCKLCALLHDPNLPPKEYTDFLYWWNMCDGLPASPIVPPFH